jgi:hypothetical protein
LFLFLFLFLFLILILILILVNFVLGFVLHSRGARYIRSSHCFCYISGDILQRYVTYSSQAILALFFSFFLSFS